MDSASQIIASQRSNKELRLDPEAHFAQTDVARLVIEFATVKISDISTMRLVCKYWNELFTASNSDGESDNTWALQVLKKCVQTSTLGSDSSTEQAYKYFSDDMEAEYIWDDTVDDSVKEDIEQHGFFKNKWLMYFQPLAEQDTVPKPQLPLIEVLKGCTICISGIQNPERGELRDKLLQLGASYAPDLNTSCTHLIAVYANAPKVVEAKKNYGNVLIVKKEWITECHDKKERLDEKKFDLSGNRVPDWLEKRRNARPEFYTQVEHSDFFSDLNSAEEILEMHKVINGLFALSKHIKANGVMLSSEGESEFAPFILRWDPSLPFENSKRLLDAFRVHIGWALPALDEHDFIKDAPEDISDDYDDDGTLKEMFRRVANLSLVLSSGGSSEPAPGEMEGKLPEESKKEEQDDKASDEEDDDEKEKSEPFVLPVPMYHLNYAPEAMSCFPRFYVTRSANRKYLIGVFGTMVWT